MSQTVSFNNTNFSLPDVGDRLWGQNVTNFLISVAQNALSKAGGSFTLTADANFGANYGLLAKYFKSVSSNISTTGVVRSANDEGIGWRNAANNADLILKVDNSDRIKFGAETLCYLSELAAHESDTSTHGVGTVAGLTETQVFTNKDYDGGTASNSSRITVPKDTYANLLLLTRKEGTIVYATDLDTVFYDDGSTLQPVGSGAGGSGEKNYITNPSAANNTDGWAISGAGTLARTTTASNLPREFTTGTAFAFTSDADEEYVYTRFSRDDVDAAKRLKLLLDYLAASSNFRVEMWKNSASDYFGSYTEISLLTDVSGDSYLAAGTTVFPSQFDLGDAVHLELRVVHNGTNSDTIYFSDVLVGPGKLLQGPIVGEPIPFSPSGQGFGTFGTSYLQYRQVGQYMHITGRFTAGNTTGDTARLNLPYGTIGTYGGVEVITFAGKWTRNSSNSANFVKQGVFIVTSGTSYVEFGLDDYTTAGFPYTPRTGTDILGNGDVLYIEGEIVIPIKEWANAASVNLLNQNTQSPIKAGVIQAWAGATIPTGWLECDGTAYDQTTYPQLYASLGSTWNTCTNPLTGSAYSAPSAGQFRVPDLRGVFLRGAGTFSDGIGTDTTLAGYQADQFQGHYHTNSALVDGTIGTTGNYSATATLPPAAGSGTPFDSSNKSQSNYVRGPISDESSNGTPRTGKETRPRNVGVKYIIKAWDESFNLAGFAEATADRMGLVQGGKVPGQTSGAAIATGYVGEYAVDTGTSTITGGSGTYSSSTDCSVSPDAGVHLLLADVSVFYGSAGGTGGVTGFVAIVDDLGNVIAEKQMNTTAGGLAAGSTAFSSEFLVGVGNSDGARTYRVAVKYGTDGSPTSPFCNIRPDTGHTSRITRVRIA